MRDKLVGVLRVLAKFADTYKNLPTLAFTHFQPASPPRLVSGPHCGCRFC